MEYIPIEGIERGYISDMTRLGNEIIAVYSETNQALSFNMETETVCLRQLGSLARRFTDIANIGDILYMDKKLEKMKGGKEKSNIIVEKKYYRLSK